MFHWLGEFDLQSDCDGFDTHLLHPNSSFIVFFVNFYEVLLSDKNLNKKIGYIQRRYWIKGEK